MKTCKMAMAASGRRLRPAALPANRSTARSGVRTL